MGKTSHIAFLRHYKALSYLLPRIIYEKTIRKTITLKKYPDCKKDAIKRKKIKKIAKTDRIFIHG
jgi:hypothetical protein